MPSQAKSSDDTGTRHGAGSISSDAQRWSILALLFVCRAGLGFQFQALGSVSGTLVADLGFSYAQIGTLIGAFMLPGLVLALPAGYLGRWLPDRMLVGLAFLCLAVGGVIASLAQGFGWLALGRVAAGAGFVVSTIYLTKMIVDWFDGRELATALGILVMSWPFGIALGQIGQVWIDMHFGWHSVFLAAAVYCTASAAGVLMFYRTPPKARPAQSLAPGLPRQELVLTLLAAAAWGLFNAGYIVYLSFAPQVLIAGGYGPAQAAAVVSLASWVMVVSGPIGGRLADRSGKPGPMVYVCTALAVLSLLLLQRTSLAVVVSLMIGLFGGAPAGAIMALTGEAMAPQRRAFGMGLFFSLYFVFLSLAPPVAGWLFDRSADASVPIVFAALMFAAAACVYRLFRMTQGRFAQA